MPVHVTWRAFFPVYRGVMRGMQVAAAAAGRYSEQLRDLEGHDLMSTL